MRVIDDGTYKLALLANGCDCAFATCWPRGSRLLMDLFVDAWHGTSGSAEERLLGAFALASERFSEWAPALVARDDVFPDDVPLATLMAVVVEGTTAHVAWVGGDVAIIARDANVVFETTPHSLVERLRREHPAIADVSRVPNVIVRTIGPVTAQADPPDYLTTTLAARDTLVLLSRATFRGPCVPTREAAATAESTKEPAALAAQLADAALRNTDAAFAAVAVLRMEASS